MGKHGLKLNSDALTHDLAAVASQFNIPGMAVATCRGNQIVFESGFGFRDLNHHKKFDCETLCLVASITKSFTSTLVGILNDLGIVDWQSPVRSYISDFKMNDAIATQYITLTDMMCHRSGLPCHENLLAHGVARDLKGDGRDFRKDLLRRLQYFEPSSEFRSEFQYQDIVFTAVGGIVESITGQRFETLIDEHVLSPLGMDATFSRRRAKSTERLTLGYAVADSKPVEIPHCDTRYIAPTAGLYMSAREMLKWLQFHLRAGRIDNNQFISKESLNWIYRAHIAADSYRYIAQDGQCTYGLGWFRSNFKGHLMFSHTGSFNGHRTAIAFIPALDIGAVVFCNLNLTKSVIGACQVAMSHMLGQPDCNAIVKHFKLQQQKDDELRAKIELDFQMKRNPNNPPSQPLTAYEGTYHHPGYGRFDVALINERLTQVYDGRRFDLLPYNGNIFATDFQSTENNLLKMIMTFGGYDDSQFNFVDVPIVPDICPPRFMRTGAPP